MCLDKMGHTSAFTMCLLLCCVCSFARMVADDVIAHVETWSLNDLSLKDLIKMVAKPRALQKVVVVH